MDTSMSNKLDQIKIQTNACWLFCGRLIARANMALTDEIPTAATDGIKTIMFNPSFIKGMSDSDLVLLMCHEMMHIILRATYGLDNPDNKMVWNYAEDIVINSILQEHFFESGSAGLFRPGDAKVQQKGIWPVCDKVSIPIDGGSSITITDIKQKSVRDIYWEILRQLPANASAGGSTIDDHSKLVFGDGQGSGDGDGDNHDSNGSGGFSPEEIEKIRKDWQQKIAQEATAEAKRNKGALPGFLGSLISEIKDAKIPWRDRLRNAMMASIITDTSYTIWNKRNCSLGMPMPGYVREGLDAIVHLDTSGSTAGDLADFLSEIKAIAAIVPNSKVTVIQCDSDIQSVDDISADFDEFEAKGFGGTSHQPVVDYINNMEVKPKIFVSFTDGWSDIEHCYNDLPDGVSRIICVPKSEYKMQDSLSQYGDVLVID